MTGSQEFLDRRLEPFELLSERFDSADCIVQRRLFLFAQPRSASFTLCRLLAAAGWGLPLEYFSLQTIELCLQRFSGNYPAEGMERAEMLRFADELERRRTRNGVFSAKIMWDAVGRFQMVYATPAARLMNAHHLYLRRSDFESQVVSFMMLQATGVYSFSDRHLRNTRRQDTLLAEEHLRRTATHLMKEEQRWFALFDKHGLKPVMLQYEDVIGNPGRMFDILSGIFRLPYQKESLLRCVDIEKGGRYLNQATEKAELRHRHRDLLHELAEVRNRQFDELTEHYGLPLA